MLEKAANDVETEALPNAGAPGGSGQRLVQAGAELPPDAEAIGGQGEAVALRTQAREAQHQGALEEDHGIDRRSASVGIGVLDPIPDEPQIEAGIAAAGAMVAGDEGVERNSDGETKRAGLGRTAHRGTPRCRDAAVVRPAAGNRIVPEATTFARRRTVFEMAGR